MAVDRLRYRGAVLVDESPDEARVAAHEGRRDEVGEAQREQLLVRVPEAARAVHHDRPRRVERVEQPRGPHVPSIDGRVRAEEDRIHRAERDEPRFGIELVPGVRREPPRAVGTPLRETDATERRTGLAAADRDLPRFGDVRRVALGLRGLDERDARIPGRIDAGERVEHDGDVHASTLWGGLRAHIVETAEASTYPWSTWSSRSPPRSPPM